MFAIKGFTRFPIFYTSDGSKILGAKPKINLGFVDYVYNLPDEPLIAVREIARVKPTRRIVVDRRAINFQTKNLELYPVHMYIFDDTTPDVTFNNALVQGFTVKGARARVFIPLILLSRLTQEEVKVFQVFAHRSRYLKKISLGNILQILKGLNIEVTAQKPYQDKISLKIYDPEIDVQYSLLIDKSLGVVDTNICFDSDTPYYLPEFIVFIRRAGRVYTYPEERYDWT